jgi:hypothetical protein
LKIVIEHESLFRPQLSTGLLPELAQILIL